MALVNLEQDGKLRVSATDFVLLQQALDHKHARETVEGIEPQCFARLTEGPRIVLTLEQEIREPLTENRRPRIGRNGPPGWFEGDIDGFFVDCIG